MLQHPWIREMQRLPPALKRAVRELGFLYFDTLPDFAFAAAPGEPTALDEQLRVVERLSVKEFAFQAARHALPPDEATELRRRLLELLETYWRESFGATWAELEPRLAETARRAEKAIAAGSWRFSAGSERSASTPRLASSSVAPSAGVS